MFLTGDWHSTFVNDLKLDFKDPAAPTVATEFVTPAITTGGDDTPYGPYYAPMVPFNPHIKYYEGDRRGYMKATVTKKQLQVDLRFVTSVEDPTAPATPSARSTSRTACPAPSSEPRVRRTSGGRRGLTSAPVAETVEFQSNGGTASGYLVSAAGRFGPGRRRDSGVVGPRFRHQGDGRSPRCRRVRGAGADLYHGELAGHDEMDKAAELMQGLPPDRAARDMSGAVDYLAGHDAVTGDGIGVVGFCMGGMLSFILAANRPDQVKAVVPFYGFPQGDVGARLVRSDGVGPAGTWPRTTTSSVPTRHVRSRRSCRAMGKDVTFTVHPGTGHAFMGPHNALGTLDEELAAQDLARGRRVPAREAGLIAVAGTTTANAEPQVIEAA